MKSYLDMVRHILAHGDKKEDRTGVGTLSIFGYQTRYDCRNGFPLVTTKKIMFDSIVRELLWFLSGSTNINDGLHPHTKIWDPWADAHGELGPIYGYQWRKWEAFKRSGPDGGYQKTHIDQLQAAIHLIKTNPDSRRIIVSAWNVADVDRMALPPCHTFFQFYVVGRYLDCQLYQRSADTALGVPFNIASYALLLHMIAQHCDLTPRYFVHTFGDAHIYLNHVNGLTMQLQRPLSPLPTIQLARKSIFDMQFDDIQLHNYTHAPFIKFPIAV